MCRFQGKIKNRAERPPSPYTQRNVLRAPFASHSHIFRKATLLALQHVEVWDGVANDQFWMFDALRHGRPPEGDPSYFNEAKKAKSSYQSQS